MELELGLGCRGFGKAELRFYHCRAHSSGTPQRRGLQDPPPPSWSIFLLQLSVGGWKRRVPQVRRNILLPTAQHWPLGLSLHVPRWAPETETPAKGTSQAFISGHLRAARKTRALLQGPGPFLSAVTRIPRQDPKSLSAAGMIES